MSHKIWVISENSNSKRRRIIMQQLVDFKYTFFDAIYPSKSCLPFHRAIKKTLETHQMNLSELGCLLSHRRLWKKLAFSNDDYYIILEDDIQINIRRLKKITQNETRWLFDLLMLGAFDGYVQPQYRTLRFNRKLGIIATPVFDTLYCSYGYIISQDCAKKLLSLTQHITHPVDYWKLYMDCMQCNVLCCFPNVVYPNTLAWESSIQKGKRIPSSFERILFSILFFLKTILKSFLKTILKSFHRYN